MPHLSVEDLLDEDMQRALIEARLSIARAEQRPQREKDIARRNLLRWLGEPQPEEPAPH